MEVAYTFEAKPVGESMACYRVGMKICAVKTCSRDARGGCGYCNSHYHKYRRYGNPEGGFGYQKRHGLRKSHLSEHRAWVAMKSRCSDPKVPCFYRYGGRGITVCERWGESFINFLEDMGPKPSSKHSLERKDNDGDYEPGNCKWATLEEQANNRNSSTFIEYKGLRKTKAQWEKQLGFRPGLLSERINKYGWDPCKAIETEVRGARS